MLSLLLSHEKMSFGLQMQLVSIFDSAHRVCQRILVFKLFPRVLDDALAILDFPLVNVANFKPFFFPVH